MKFGIIEELKEEVVSKARLWCTKNNGWISIVDIKNINDLYETFEEVSFDKKMFWENIFGKKEAVSAYNEYSVKKCKYEYGFVNIEGHFYNDLLDVPIEEDVVTVYNMNR